MTLVMPQRAVYSSEGMPDHFFPLPCRSDEKCLQIRVWSIFHSSEIRTCGCIRDLGKPANPTMPPVSHVLTAGVMPNTSQLRSTGYHPVRICETGEYAVTRALPTTVRVGFPRNLPVWYSRKSIEYHFFVCSALFPGAKARRDISRYFTDKCVIWIHGESISPIQGAHSFNNQNLMSTPRWAPYPELCEEVLFHWQYSVMNAQKTRSVLGVPSQRSLRRLPPDYTVWDHLCKLNLGFVKASYATDHRWQNCWDTLRSLEPFWWKKNTAFCHIFPLPLIEFWSLFPARWSLSVWPILCRGEDGGSFTWDHWLGYPKIRQKWSCVSNRPSESVT